MVRTEIIDDPAIAASMLRDGGLVAFPTETVYGLGVDATNEQAVQRLFEAKGRPSDNPLIVHLSDRKLWSLAARHLPESAAQLLEAFSPGPLTVVIPKVQRVSPFVTAGLDTVGVRIPAQPLALAMLELAACPIAAPSANRSGRPSCTTWKAVLEDMDGRIDGVLRGDVCDIGLESTVVDCTTECPVILRSGRITLSQIQAIIPSAIAWRASESAESIVERDRTVASPGTRHPHYQPRAQVVLFESLDELSELDTATKDTSAVVLVSGQQEQRFKFPANFAFAQQFDSLEEYARGFYEILREVDRRQLQSVYLQLVKDDDAGQALRDRQLRAAGEK